MKPGKEAFKRRSPMMALPNPQDLPGRVSSLETSIEFIHQKLDSQDGWMRMVHEEMNAGFAQLRQEIKEGLDKAHEETNGLRQEMNAGFAQFRQEMVGWQKWILGTGAIAWVTIIAAILLKR
ncbi:MAG: hypothetical protein M1169_07845 [Firmicutes bacterium]|nr:hypothetical protein [Bacillota bacterium]